MYRLSNSDWMKLFWDIAHYEVDELFVREYKQWLRQRNKSESDFCAEISLAEGLHDNIEEYVNLPGVI